MLRYLIDPPGKPNAIAASARALLIISSVSAGGTRSRPCSLLIPPASAPRARPHCRSACHHHSISYHVILGHYDVPGQLPCLAGTSMRLRSRQLQFQRANGLLEKSLRQPPPKPLDSEAGLPHAVAGFSLLQHHVVLAQARSHMISSLSCQYRRLRISIGRGNLESSRRRRHSHISDALP
jgi:hypothetical protein